MKKFYSFLIIILVVSMTMSLMLIGCKDKSEVTETSSGETTAADKAVAETTSGASDTSAEKTVLVIGISNTPSGIDIDIEGDPQTFEIIDAVYDGGTERKYAEMTLEDGYKMKYEDESEKGMPWMFESYELDPDSRVITVKIKKGIKSAYGNELTSKDFEWTYKRNAALKAIGLFALQCTGVELSQNLGDFKIIDDYTYQITQNKIKYPIDRWELMNANLWCAPWDSTEALKHVTDEDPWASEWIGVNGGGFGPYYITEWTAGQQIILEANPNYWGNKPAQFTKVIYKVIPENANRIAALKEGTIDIAAGLTQREMAELKGTEGVRIIDVTGPAFLMLWMNRELVPAFKDPKVIQAINCAIPRDDISKLAYYGFAKPMTTVVPKMVGGGVTKESEWPFAYDLDKAKQLLSETQYAEGFNVVMFYDASYPTYETTCLLIKESLEKIGIKIDLQKAPSGVYDSQLRNRELQMFVYPTTTWSAEPFMPLLQWYGVNHFENYGNWDNTEFDKLVEDGSLITDEAEREAMLGKVGKILLEDPPVGYIVETNDVIAVREEIQNWNWEFEHNCKLDWLTWQEIK